MQADALQLTCDYRIHRETSGLMEGRNEERTLIGREARADYRGDTYYIGGAHVSATWNPPAGLPYQAVTAGPEEV
jgi:hypothetical protein